MLARATVALAAEMVGTARRLFAMTLEYAKDRVQFGVPIGSFQAIQHKLADMSLDVERAWSAVYYAAMTVDADDADRHRAVHVAKAAAGEAAKRAAKDGIQIHGGIGYTWEHDLHLFMRRAFGTEALLGTTGWHHDRLADLLMGLRRNWRLTASRDAGAVDVDPERRARQRRSCRRNEAEELAQYVDQLRLGGESRLARAGPDTEQRQTSDDVDSGRASELQAVITFTNPESGDVDSHT